MDSSYNRFKCIDILRALAILGVVLCHAIGAIYTFNLEHISAIQLPSKIFAFFSLTLGRLGVPIFLIISGYLLLDREYNIQQTTKFWRNKWFHLFLCTELWFLFYDVFLFYSQYNNISFLQIVEDLLFIHNLNFNHVWYMPMILGMYILIPFVANALRVYNTKHLMFPLLFFSLYAFGYPFINIINSIFGNPPLALQLSMGFSGGTYGVYIVLGYILKKGQLKKIRSYLLIIIAIIFFILGVLFQIWAYTHSYQYNIWYDSPFILITSVTIFELFSRISSIPIYAVFKWLSYYSFAVYLIHNIILTIIFDRIYALPYIKPVRVALLWFLCISISFLCAWIIGKVPRVGKFILYLK